MGDVTGRLRDDSVQRPQSQLALDDQLRSLQVLANQWGYYDAADFISRHLARFREVAGE